MKYIITAESNTGLKMVASYDPVFDSLMVPDEEDEIYVLFDSKKEAQSRISAYQSFQRHLKNWKVEKYE